MQDWQEQLAQALTSVEELAGRFGVDPAPLRETAARYPLRVTPHYLGMIEAPGDAIWRQCVPDSAELQDDARLCADPLAESHHSPVAGVVHRHRDRALLLVAGACPTLCRFCFRKGRLDTGAFDLPPSQFDEAIAYLEATPQIREVILTGGEPLLLGDERLGDILAALGRIAHIDLVRIHTRVPVVLPARMTDDLVDLLRGSAPLYLMIHVNHPRELTAEFAD
ncbi:MAG: radical SAM protein, partial [Desulfuromonadales bacterium]|nr:radical SAM protein [Desulfuromonadales bacterium]NIS42877.1 radical SAM protein [Desulfuromonadales bacterium]